MSIHTHEVFFRDTAHVFLAWSVALVMIGAFLTSAGSAIAGSARGAKDSENSGSTESMTRSYFAESFLRTPTAPNAADESLKEQISVIFAHGLAEGALPPSDQAFLAQVVSARSGVNESEASKCVADSFPQLQEATNRARKTVAHAMYWTFLALLVGAFCASVAATVGGKQRDHVVVV